jgi:hypothetical protein
MGSLAVFALAGLIAIGIIVLVSIAHDVERIRRMLEDDHADD